SFSFSNQSGLDEAAPDRVADEARRLVDVELAHQPGPMRFGGLRADPQHLAYFLGGLALADQLKDLPLARGEQVRRIIRLGEVRIHHRARDDRSEEHTSELQTPSNLVCRLLLEKKRQQEPYDQYHENSHA